MKSIEKLFVRIINFVWSIAKSAVGVLLFVEITNAIRNLIKWIKTRKYTKQRRAELERLKAENERKLREQEAKLSELQKQAEKAEQMYLAVKDEIEKAKLEDDRFTSETRRLIDTAKQLTTGEENETVEN